MLVKWLCSALDRFLSHLVFSIPFAEACRRLLHLLLLLIVLQWIYNQTFFFIPLSCCVSSCETDKLILETIFWYLCAESKSDLITWNLLLLLWGQHLLPINSTVQLHKQQIDQELNFKQVDICMPSSRPSVRRLLLEWKRLRRMRYTRSLMFGN